MTREELIRSCVMLVNSHYADHVATPLSKDALKPVYKALDANVPANPDFIQAKGEIVQPTDADWDSMKS